RRVEGGGEYFIISRSFGKTIGGVIGISLFVSQAISVAFYMAAFAETFSTVGETIEASVGLYDPRIVSIPGAIAVAALVLTRGASLGVSALAVITGVQVLAIIFFFLGGSPPGVEIDRPLLLPGFAGADPFMLV